MTVVPGDEDEDEDEGEGESESNVSVSERGRPVVGFIAVMTVFSVFFVLFLGIWV